MDSEPSGAGGHDAGIATYAFDVGAIHCIAIHDGDTTYEATQYVVNAPLADVEVALKAHGVQPDNIPSPYSGLVVETAGRRLLIDTGAGDLTPEVGHLHANLRAAGIDRDFIETIVVTHGHPDHLGGNVGEGGEPAFPRARLVMGWRDWAFWTDDTELSRLAPIFGRWSRRNLDPYADRLDLADGEVEIASGVHVLAAPGHTPGHIAVALRSEGSELLYVSDAALHPIHLEHPEWRSVWDQEPDDALATRRRLFDHAASDGSTVLAFHFPPFPSLGRVEKRGSGWHWEPVSLETPF